MGGSPRLTVRVGATSEDTPVPYPQALQPPNGVPEGALRKRSFSAKSLKGSELI